VGDVASRLVILWKPVEEDDRDHGVEGVERAGARIEGRHDEARLHDEW
jgi:hypothetical protein